jgi:hypothetical protein
MSVAGKFLCHDVCKHIVRGAIFDVDCTLFHMVCDEVELDVDVLCRYAVGWIFRE